MYELVPITGAGKFLCDLATNIKIEKNVIKTNQMLTLLFNEGPTAISEIMTTATKF